MIKCSRRCRRKRAVRQIINIMDRILDNATAIESEIPAAVFTNKERISIGANVKSV